MLSYRSFIITGVAFGLSLGLISCASTTPQAPTSAPRSVLSSPQPSLPAPASGGTYHTVRSGETLWRISKLYNVPVAVITQANNLTSHTIRVGERIFVPTALGVGAVAGAVADTAGKTAESIIMPRRLPVTSGGFMWPVQGQVVTRFGEMRDNVTTKGIEIATAQNQPIGASQAGVVSFESDSVKGYGRMIIIDHAGGYQTVYAYNSENLVSKGKRVAKGEVIARAGVSGRTQRPTLHFEIRRHHDPLDPQALLS